MASYTKRNGSWHVRVRRKGYETECAVFATKREAEDWAGGVEERMATGAHVVDKNSRRVTLEQVIDEYLKKRVPQLKGHQPRYETLDWKRRPLAKRIIGTISVDDVVAWMNLRLSDQVDVYKRDMRGQIVYDDDGNPVPGKNPRLIRPKTVLNELLRLSAIFTWARTTLKMRALVNPVSQIPEDMMPRGKWRDRRLKRKELDQLIRAAKTDELPLIGAIIAFAVETACRRGEIVKIELRDYDPVDRTLLLRDTKNGTDRKIGLTPRAIAILESLEVDEDGRFFPVEADEISRAFRRCCRVTMIDGKPVEPIGDRLDFDGLTFHDLRHEGTSLYFEKGLQIAEVAHQTGHRSYQSLKRYTHPKGKAIAVKLAG